VFVETRPSQIEPAEAIEAIAPPGPIVDFVAHGLAELAVTRHVDADFLLPAHDIAHRRFEGLLESPLVGGFAGFALAIGFDQVVGTRQATGVTGQNVVAAGSHWGMGRRKADDGGRAESVLPVRPASVAVAC